MTNLEYKLLGLLARQPMSGYDLTRVLKQNFIPFGAVSHTQIYPALASLEKQEYVRCHIVEQNTGRPNKKVYELTDGGRAALRLWVESETALPSFNDEFFLKAYSLWLADPNAMKDRFHEQIRLHEERLALYEKPRESAELSGYAEVETPEVAALNDLLFSYVIGCEKNYLEWCRKALTYLERADAQDGFSNRVEQS